MVEQSTGALAGMRVVEFAGLGPGPFAAMLLADLGAEVVRIDRPAAQGASRQDVVNRGKRSLAVDLKDEAGRDLVLRLVDTADVLLEGFRPGVAERLGLGPQECATRNPRLVYGRMTGWGQQGPLAGVAGHDIDYIALSGALWATGRVDERPTPALNLLGDYAGGSMFLVMGVLAALIEVGRSGRGQVVDAAMVDGASVLTTMFTALRSMGVWEGGRGQNVLDTGAPWYEVYACADGRFVAVGALEPQFYAQLLEGLGLTDAGLPAQHDLDGWPELRARFTETFAGRTRDEWATVFGDTDACVVPVLSMAEAVEHPHNIARGTFVEADGVVQPVPAPRFSRTPATLTTGAREPGEDADAVRADWGV